jgi:hypothetical protein
MRNHQKQKRKNETKETNSRPSISSGKREFQFKTSFDLKPRMNVEHPLEMREREREREKENFTKRKGDGKKEIRVSRRLVQCV